MGDPPRIYPGGTMAGMQIRELTGGQLQTLDLVELAESGFTIYGQDDLDYTHRPWLICRADQTIWRVESGQPSGGVTPRSHAILMDDPSHWAFLVAAKHSGRSDAPAHVGELEHRRAQAEAEAQRQEAERQRKLAAARKSAQPVTLARVEGGPRPTLAAAAATVEVHGGRVELRKNGELQVALPPTVGAGSAPVEAARILYLARDEVVACLKAAKPLPDAEVLPSGAVVR